jgi:serine/threonine-protein kinase
VLAAAAATIALVVIAVFVIPRLGGSPGLELPDETAPPTTTATTTPTATGTGTTATPPAAGTVPPFEPGTVPNFVGVDRAEAERVVAEVGLTPLIFETPNEAPAGEVFQQVPAAGADIDTGGTVTLFVSQGAGP